MTGSTQRHRIEDRLAAQYAVARALAEAGSVREAASQVLRAVGENLGWQCGAMWRMRGDALRCLEFWSSAPQLAGEFDRLTREGVRPPGVGIPGRTWAAGAPVWMRDVLSDGSIPRHKAAASAGLRSAVAFPVFVDGAVEAVVEYFSQQIREPEADLLEMFTAIGDQIGQFIKRHRAESALRFLAEASAILGSSLEFETTLRNMAQLAVPSIADCCTIDLVGDDGQVARLAAVHLQDGKTCSAKGCERCCMADPMCRHGIAQVIRSGKSELYSQVDEVALAALARDDEHRETLKAVGLTSVMIVPLASRGRTLGAMSFVSIESGRRYTPEDLAHAQEVARRAAIAVDNARLYREAQLANHMKDEFLATVSHELRTPLSAMLGWARLLAMGKLDEPTRQEAVDAIARNAQAQARLIEDLLDLSRIIRGKLPMEILPTELPRVIDLAIASAQPAATAKGVEIRRDLLQGVPAVLGDPSRLRQIVCNLLSNAVKFTPSGGWVHVRLEQRGCEVRIVVEDTGKGIPADFLPYVFDRFRQADSSTTRRHGGLGLGLAIVRHLVELHGGTVMAENAGDHRGARFTVGLPAAPAGARAGASLTSARVSVERTDMLSGVRVLVVDDEEDARKLLTTLLRRAGAEVESAASAPQALSKMEQFAPNVLLSDIGMPGEDGYELMRKVRARDPAHGGRTPAAALTAFARGEDRMRAIAAGFQMHLSKPVEPTELLEAVRILSGR